MPFSLKTKILKLAQQIESHGDQTEILKKLSAMIKSQSAIDDDTALWELEPGENLICELASRGRTQNPFFMWLIQNVKTPEREVPNGYSDGLLFEILIHENCRNKEALNLITWKTVLAQHKEGIAYTYDDGEEDKARKYYFHHKDFREYLQIHRTKRSALVKAGVDLTFWERDVSFVEMKKILKRDNKISDLGEDSFLDEVGSGSSHDANTVPTIQEYCSRAILQPILRGKLIGLQARQSFDLVTGANPSKQRRHLVFSGNPGTGKTEMAKVIGRYYKDLDILKRGHVVDTTATLLTGAYTGQTAPKIRKAVEQALDGVLFIDEVYNFNNKETYGNDAVEELLKQMEEHRGRFILIVAGYEDKMHNFLRMNAGLSDRFNDTFPFEDFTRNELCQILDINLESQHLSMDDDARSCLLDFMEELRWKSPNSYANARTLESVLNLSITQHAVNEWPQAAVFNAVSKFPESPSRRLKLCDIQGGQRDYVRKHPAPQKSNDFTSPTNSY